ncbi:hypothetical protein [Streptomyces sp. MBT28]|uniref:hypothetical protein n=1 Tax=Streptomyces sp. MBT28 TaxID=1488357 RepID=UPI00131C4B68|nr:hypothetical protein [Streptomyces sp. MBT28]
MSLTHTPAWHAIEAADERAWLDQWARLHNTTTLEPEPTTEAPTLLTTAGSPR